jgi:copper chaperone
MTTFSIPDMSCGHCKASIDKTLKTLDPSAALDFDMAARTVAVKTIAPTEDVKAALLAAGYTCVAA